MRWKQLILFVFLLVALLVVVPGCGGDDESGGALDTAAETEPEDVETEDAEAEDGDGVGAATGDLGDARIFPLVEQNASGMSGEFTVSPTGDDAVKVAIDLEGGDGGPHPAHIHRGSCQDIGEIAYPLESVEDGTSTTAVEVSLDELEDGDYAVNVHKSEEEIETYVACGEI